MDAYALEGIMKKWSTKPDFNEIKFRLLEKAIEERETNF